MNTIDRKLRFVQEFLRVADEDIISKLELVLRSERKKKILKELSPMTMNEFNSLVDQSEEDFKKGRYTDTNDLLKSIETWK